MSTQIHTEMWAKARTTQHDEIRIARLGPTMWVFMARDLSGDVAQHWPTYPTLAAARADVDRFAEWFGVYHGAVTA